MGDRHRGQTCIRVQTYWRDMGEGQLKLDQTDGDHKNVSALLAKRKGRRGRGVGGKKGGWGRMKR